MANNGLTHMRGAIIFFRDDQLTTQVQVNGPILDRVARDEEPELDRLFAAHRLGTALGRAPRRAIGLPIRSDARVARAAPDAGAHLRASRYGWRRAHGDDLLDAINNEVFALDKLRTFEAADLPQAQEAVLDFDAAGRADRCFRRS